VVKIVVPLRGISLDSAARAHQAVRLVAVVLEDEMNLQAGDVPSHGLGNFIDDVGRAFVDDGVHGVETEAVEVELFEPIKSVVYEKVTHRTTMPGGEIRRGAPRSTVSLGKELRCDRRQVVTFGTEVVVDDIEEDGEPAGMAGLDEPLQLLRRAIPRSRA
jgi:hypothetical protein